MSLAFWRDQQVVLERKIKMKYLFHFRSGEKHLAPNEQISAGLASLILSMLTIIFLVIPERKVLLGFSEWTIPSGLAIYIVGQMWNLFWLLRLERRRFAAFTDERCVARTQPTLLPLIIQRPFVITWRIKWTYPIPWLLILGWWLVSANRSFLVLVATVSIVPALYFLLRFKIEVNEEGIMEKGVGVSKKVEWSEARFFACYNLPIFFWSKNIVHYELSSQTTRITWLWIYDLKSPFTAWNPGLSPEEYERQMRALCTLILKETKLPLYDLRI